MDDLCDAISRQGPPFNYGGAGDRGSPLKRARAAPPGVGNAASPAGSTSSASSNRSERYNARMEARGKAATSPPYEGGNEEGAPPKLTWGARPTMDPSVTTMGDLDTIAKESFGNADLTYHIAPVRKFGTTYVDGNGKVNSKMAVPKTYKNWGGMKVGQRIKFTERVLWS